jgi:CO dehydrogenase maturation factor
MGTVEKGGGGCFCPENVMVKRLISHLVVQRDEVVVMDMEAGLEHLGRGTAGMVDRFIVVVEPGARSVQTYGNVVRLASDLGVSKVNVVGNKVRSADDEAFLRGRLPPDALLGIIHYNDEIAEADRRGTSPFETSEGAKVDIRAIKEKLDAA